MLVPETLRLEMLAPGSCALEMLAQALNVGGSECQGSE
jgi:hypothetical protein